MGYFHCQEAQQVGPIWTQFKSLQQYKRAVLSSCYRAISWTHAMAHSDTGHTPANNSAATFPLSLFLIQTPITNHLPRHYPDNSTVLQPVKNTKCTLKFLWQCLFPLEKKIFLIPWVLHSPSLSISLMAWAHITEQLMFHKTMSLETSASQKNPRTVNKKEKFWKTTNSLGEQWGDCDAVCALGETANEVFAAVRGEARVTTWSNTITMFASGLFITKDSFSGCQVTLLFNLVSHLSQIYLKTEREIKISLKDATTHYDLHLSHISECSKLLTILFH